MTSESVKETVKVKIFRYNPEVDSVPTYKTYEVPWKQEGNVMQLLFQIYKTVDNTLAFHYYACGYRFCNSCMMTVNGKGTQACFAMVNPGDEVVLEPMKGYPVIRDLAVDFGTLYQTPDAAFQISKGVTIRKL